VTKRLTVLLDVIRRYSVSRLHDYVFLWISRLRWLICVRGQQMKWRLVVCVLIGISTFLSTMGADASDGFQPLVGTWMMQPPSLPGVVNRDFLTFKVVAGRAVGIFRSEPLGLSYPIGNVRIAGDAVSFRVGSEADGEVRWAGRFRTRNELEIHRIPTHKTSEAAEDLPVVIFRSASEAEISKVRAGAKDLVMRRTNLPQLRDLPPNGMALSPPMGWSSWNHFATSIAEGDVRATADALVATGLREAGYVYVNIDDGWQGSRDRHGVLRANSKFPDMKALADYVHSRGLKIGIYSSPGPLTCGGYVGSRGHESQDAETFARWGIDYLKYDWCSVGLIYKTQSEMQAAYQKMGAALQRTGRPIVYSLCQYGLFEVGSWGRKVGGNLWRISDDISDTYASIANNGFEMSGVADHTGPGGWNDPDMLEVGNGGMNPDEYRTQLTLWSTLAAPLLLGNDLRVMTAEIRAMLLNDEVIAIDQDPLGRQGQLRLKDELLEVWTKPLADSAVAVALFNRGTATMQAQVRWSDLGLSGRLAVRDLWKHEDLQDPGERYETLLPPHGAALLKVVALH